MPNCRFKTFRMARSWPTPFGSSARPTQRACSTDSATTATNKMLSAILSHPVRLIALVISIYRSTFPLSFSLQKVCHFCCDLKLSRLDLRALLAARPEFLLAAKTAQNHKNEAKTSPKFTTDFKAFGECPFIYGCSFDIQKV